MYQLLCPAASGVSESYKKHLFASIQGIQENTYMNIYISLSFSLSLSLSLSLYIYIYIYICIDLLFVA